MVTVPIVRLDGTGFKDPDSSPLGDGRSRAVACPELAEGAPAPHPSAPHAPFEVSQNFFTVLFYLRSQKEALAGARARFPDLIRANP
jgi:hypothetical protein